MKGIFKLDYSLQPRLPKLIEALYFPNGDGAETIFAIGHPLRALKNRQYFSTMTVKYWRVTIKKQLKYIYMIRFWRRKFWLL